ncbi:1,4-alpha-glucan branching protein [Streptomyces sp. NPDC102406]|uniref:maltokinase N-terminal cap-like domain-containing protein n=1 Tax=Streptomyces sp. NPDC102406 TaxID=3366171 RepID=UPI0038201A1E
MSIIHHTTLKPTKLELLTDWLPGQPWYEGSGTPELTKAGGFRLDDPAGEVGIEFLAVTDGSGGRPVTYLAPLTYRGAPLPDAPRGALVGTLVHGVLGERWVYDGAQDPVSRAQLTALLKGEVPAHAQSVDGALDPSVHARLDADATGTPEIVRVLEPGEAAPGTPGHISAEWRQADGNTVRGVFVTVGRGV